MGDLGEVYFVSDVRQPEEALILRDLHSLSIQFSRKKTVAVISQFLTNLNNSEQTLQSSNLRLGLLDTETYY